MMANIFLCFYYQLVQFEDCQIIQNTQSYCKRHSCLCIETHVVFGAKFSDFGEVALVWHHHPSLALDGLHHESSNIWVLENFLEKEKKNDSSDIFILVQDNPVNKYMLF